MSNDIKITYLPEGCVVECDGETTTYTNDEIEDMYRDYVAALRRASEKLESWKQHNESEVKADAGCTKAH